MTIRALIVDDEPPARRRLRALLREEADVEVAGEYGDGRKAAAAIQEKHPDLVFLDIQMPEMNGFDVVAAVGVAEMPAIIFVTAYEQYALKAFEVSALDYLLKPFDKARFKAALQRVRKQLERPRVSGVSERLATLLETMEREKKYVQRLVVKSAGRIYFLRADEVDWIEAAGNYVTLHSGGQKHLIRDTMNALEERLDPEKFLRVHRSTIVNADRILELQPWFRGDYVLILRDGTKLNLSRHYRHRLPKTLAESF